MHISSESYGSRYLGGEARASYKETTVWGVFQSFRLIQRLRASAERTWASKILPRHKELTVFSAVVLKILKRNIISIMFRSEI